MKEKIVITGGSGFVGSSLAKYLLKNNKEVYLILRPFSDISKLDLTNKNLHIYRYDNKLDDLINFFKSVNPVCTFHLASNFIAEHQSCQINEVIESNITFGLHILEAMKEAQTKLLVNTGTSWQHFNNDDYNPVCLYAASKQAYESLIEYYVQAEGFRVITLKLFDTYGETDRRPKLINLLNKFADEQTELNMSPGEQILNLVHVDDVCNAFNSAFKILITEKKSCHLKYSVANKKSYQLKEVIQIFESITNKKINVVWGGKPYRKREVMNLWVNGENLPNWKPKISLEEGLKLFK